MGKKCTFVESSKNLPPQYSAAISCLKQGEKTFCETDLNSSKTCHHNIQQQQQLDSLTTNNCWWFPQYRLLIGATVTNLHCSTSIPTPNWRHPATITILHCSTSTSIVYYTLLSMYIYCILYIT